MGETTVGHVAGEVVRALYGAGYMESTIGQYRKSIRALERYAGGPDAVYTRGLGAGFAASTFSERTGGFSRQRWFDYGRLARLCDSYLRSGSVDLGKWRRSRLAEPVVPGLAVCFASMFVRQVRQCFSAVWADGFPRCRHRFPVM